MVILPQLLCDRQGRATKGSQGLVQVVLLVKHRLQAATGGGRKLILLSKLVCMKVAQLCPTLRPPWTYSPRPEHWSGQTFPSPGNLPNPGIKPRTLTLQADSLPAEPQGKPKNTGVGSVSLLQGIFPTQGSNPGLSHCRRILYQLSRKGNPRVLEWVAYPFSSGSS